MNGLKAVVLRLTKKMDLDISRQLKEFLEVM